MLVIVSDSEWLYFVLYCIDGECCPMHCDPFEIYYAPPNLGITRTWICRLNFAQKSIFSGLRFFNKPEISTRDPQLEVSPGGLVLRIFISWKNPLTSVGFEPANLGSWGKHSTPRPPRPTDSEWYNLLNYQQFARIIEIVSFVTYK